MKTKSQTKFLNVFFIALVIMVALTIAGFAMAQTQEELQAEFLQLEQELIDFGYSLNINEGGYDGKR